MSSFILYRGPSLLTGRPIVAVAVTRTSNRKTGDMVQTYILSDEGMDPVTAARLGADISVCGDCRHRPANGGTCYVTLIHGPASVYRALNKGRYPMDPAAARRACKGRMVRLGTYGDPAAVPLQVWHDLTAEAAGWTGYTHQWRVADVKLREFCMASADSAGEATEAHGAQWRTFRVRRADEPLMAREMICPASEEAGKVRTCATCGACKGTQEGRSNAASVVIIVHGSKAKKFK